MVQRCFRIGSYNYLREIPSFIAPNILSKYQKEKIDINLNQRSHSEPKIARLTGGGLFQEFEWLPDSYDAFARKKMEEKRVKQMQQKLVADKPFVLGMNQFKYKYTDCFAPQNGPQKDYVYPFLSIDDPYEATREDVLRAKWLAENKILYGDFKPSI